MKKTKEEIVKHTNDFSKKDLFHSDVSDFFGLMFGGMFQELESNYLFQDFDSLFSYNKDGSLNATIDVPGIKTEDLSISIAQETVTVSGKTETETYSRSVERTFTVPEGFRLEPSHSLENGVLVLTFPLSKPEASKTDNLSVSESKDETDDPSDHLA